ncbi:DUF6788 family protein [Halosimplex halophilum]|uniref:DUF6788 family protein n=1 Tax=Halosimplex halophilum TaxID=2559572 RepID=UPI00107FC7C7|nr:DUF6788 family protein [Halosimplex halophilum]
MAGDISPPPSLPKYLAEGLPKQDASTLKATREFVEELIAERERPVESDDLPDDATVVDDGPDGYVVEELVKCGKDGCKCASGAESDMHGPYEYRYYRDDDGTLRKEYVENQ